VDAKIPELIATQDAVVLGAVATASSTVVDGGLSIS
jgi:hypothetical protein